MPQIHLLPLTFCQGRFTPGRFAPDRFVATGRLPPDFKGGVHYYINLCTLQI